MTTGFFWDEKCFWHGGGNYAGMLPVGGLVQPMQGEVEPGARDMGTQAPRRNREAPSDPLLGAGVVIVVAGVVSGLTAIVVVVVVAVATVVVVVAVPAAVAAAAGAGVATAAAVGHMFEFPDLGASQLPVFNISSEPHTCNMQRGFHKGTRFELVASSRGKGRHVAIAKNPRLSGGGTAAVDRSVSDIRYHAEMV